MKKLVFFILLAVMVLSSTVSGQTRDIKDKARKDKQSRSNHSGETYSSSDDESFGDAITGEMCGCAANILFFLFWEMTQSAQKAALEQKEMYPFVSSLETKFLIGATLNKNTLFFTPGLQGNWGIFSTDFRYTYLEDIGGSLNNIDWQVLKLNIPIKTFKAYGGVGFTYLTNPGISYFEFSLGSELRLFHNRMVVGAEYRGTTGSTDGEEFRREFNVQADYLAKNLGQFHLSPMAGFRYQEFYETFYYRIINFGVVVRYY